MGMLRDLGVSEAMMRLASGEAVHELFWPTYLAPPGLSYHGAVPPSGPMTVGRTFVPLWDQSDLVVGLWATADGLEFLEVDIESPDEPEVIARVEQGFWVSRFDALYEGDAPIEDLRAAAAAVGFRFFEVYLASRQEAEGRLGTLAAHRSWLGDLVERVSRMAAEGE